MDFASGLTLWFILATLLSQCLGKTYYCPYRSGGVNYPQFDLYADNIRVDTVTSVKFQTKGRNDAHILLQYNRNDFNNKVIEVVLGGWGNGKSVIRNAQQGSPRAEYRSSILSSSSYQWFWISWTGGVVKVGKGSNIGSSTIMSWSGLNHAINGIRVSYGYGSDGYFIFEQAVNGGWSDWSNWGACSVTCDSGTKSRSRSCTKPAPSAGGASCSGSTTETSSCTPGQCPSKTYYCPYRSGGVNYPQYDLYADNIRVDTATSVQFQTKGRNDAHILLQYNRNDFNNKVIEVVLGGWGNGKSVIRNAQQGSPRAEYSSSILSSSTYQWFWISWTGGVVKVGKGSNIGSSTIMSWSGLNHAINGIRISYGFGSDGYFKFFRPVNGGWTSWTNWGTCSLQCGTGQQTRTRACDDPPAQHGGADCGSNNQESKNCNTQPCIINGGWSSWTNWGTCSLTCGSGEQTRTRACDSPTPQHGGADCGNNDQEVQSCNTQPCPIDGGWTSWTNWGTCSLTCGSGEQTRTRACDDPPAQHGGADCGNNNQEVQNCNTHPCPIDGAWTAWTSWDTCTVTCAGGSQGRTRSCDNPPAQHGGADCSGENAETQDCNTHNCPIDGGWTQWGAWASCGVTCSDTPLYVTRDRTCTDPQPQYNGADCVGNATDTTRCNINPCPVDGAWSSWASYGPCSVTCEGGIRNRERLCDDPAPAWGGAECPGESSETGTCNHNNCDELPPVDGNWGPWDSWQGCSVTCGTGVQRRYRGCNSPAPANNGLPCWGDLFEENSCSGGSVCQVGVDGNWGAWNTIISCSVTCGDGISTKMRSCDNPYPSNGGQACVGERVIMETCTQSACPAGNNSNGYGASYFSRCPDGFFTCLSGGTTCISEEFRCDCEYDCDDGSDENELWAGCTLEQTGYCSSGNGIHQGGLLTGSVLMILMMILSHIFYQ